MSRVGNKHLNIPTNTTLDIQPNKVTVKGPLGTNVIFYNPKLINILIENNHVLVKRLNEEKTTKMLHGTVNSNLENAIIGVNELFTKTLKISGVGYKANIQGDKINLLLGYSHPVFFIIPKNLKVECITPVEIKISGIDKATVGEFAANIRSMREPEPYNGKGVIYSDEHIIRKVGKTAEGSKK